MLMQAYDNEKGAGTMSPYTFLRAIGPEPWNAAYVEPSRRPADGRYGENPNRLYQHHQFQVVMKPSPSNIQELYLQSLELLGINPLEHDIRFVEDNWENPSTGSAGLGWEVWLDGMEITQFTYFQQVGGLPTQPVTAEVTYGLERLASYIQEVDSVYDIEWADGVKYGEIFTHPEYEHSKYSFEVSDQDLLLGNFEKFEAEAKRCLDEHLVHPAYDYVLKCSHTFNLLDARGAVSVTERADYIVYDSVLLERDFEECLVYLDKVKIEMDQYLEETEKLVYLRANRTKVEKKEVSGVRVPNLEDIMEELRKESR